MTKARVRTPLALEEWRRRHRPGVPHKVLCDPAVRAFVDERLLTNTFAEIAAQCRATFGQDRAPSKSAINRYWLAFHKPLAAARGAGARR